MQDVATVGPAGSGTRPTLPRKYLLDRFDFWFNIVTP
jgi:hypothetical protein